MSTGYFYAERVAGRDFIEIYASHDNFGVCSGDKRTDCFRLNPFDTHRNGKIKNKKAFKKELESQARARIQEHDYENQ